MLLLQKINNIMRKIVENYSVIDSDLKYSGAALGDSASPKELIFHIFEDNTKDISVLDIGFGTGGLGKIIKNNPSCAHWKIDGIDGWEPNCFNRESIESGIYQNIWHGLAQELPASQISSYQIICLLDVIEHLDRETAVWLLRALLTFMDDKSYLFISTPLWFYPQEQNQPGDLEEHLIGVPVTSMLALLPYKYAFSKPLIGGFILGKRSLNFIEFFTPSSNKNFDHSKGLQLMKAVNLPYKTDTVFFSHQGDV
jgi:2-polyprenyl-3-methyl-5-hydroxy-6-metoxy-1,4-benzoquinol methylase